MEKGKKVIFLMKEKILLEKYLFIVENYGYRVNGFLIDEKIFEEIEKIESPDIFVIELDKCDNFIKRIVKRLKEKFNNSKFLILVTEMNEEVENFIVDFSIDSYLVFPVLPNQLLRGIFLLANF
jgi:preprotein translocase subunit Sec63